MTNVATARASPELVQRWREQIARQQRRRAAQGPRPLAAIGCLIHGPALDGVVDVRQVVFVRLFDERTADGQLATRVAGFACSVVPWGMKVGGPPQSRFDKNLCRAPGTDGKGNRFDLAYPDVLSLALDLDRQIEKHLRFPHLSRWRQPRWPALWAALDCPGVSDLHGAGPELEQIARRDGRRPVDVFRANERVIRGQAAFPLPFVSHAWREFAAVYADLSGLRRPQVISFDNAAKALCGFAGAIEFDLLHTRFSAAPRPIRKRRRRRRTSLIR